MTFISFNFENLVLLRQKCPNNKIQYLVESWDDEVLTKLQQYSLDLDIRYTSLSEEIVTAVHSIGHEVNCWTVNDVAVGEKLVRMGVDYITSNILEGNNER